MIQGPVEIASHGKQSRFRLGLLDQSAGDDPPAGLGPAAGLMLALGDFPARIHPLVGQAAELALEGRRHAGHHGVLSGPLLQQLQNRMKSKARVGPHPHLAQVGGNALEATGQQLHAAFPGAGVAGPQLRVPQKRGVGLQAEQGIIRALTPVARVVTHGGPLLRAEHGHDRAVQSQNQAGAVLRRVNELLQQPVIEPVQLLAEIGRGLEKEATQALRVWIIRQASQILERAVFLRKEEVSR